MRVAFAAMLAAGIAAAMPAVAMWRLVEASTAAVAVSMAAAAVVANSE
jgi:hypothetical protein